MVGVPHSPARYNPRSVVAEQVADAVRRRYATEVQAIGAHGSLAHGDDTDASDIDLVVVTRWPGTGPRPATRRIDGIVVDLGVIGAEEYLGHARTLTTSWPLAADRYLTVKAFHDPDNWYARLRDAHLTRLAGAGGSEFASLAREAWCQAKSAHGKARRLAEWYETETALILLGQARLGTALVDGLLTRTYFRNTADAIRRTGVASADISDLDARLAAQAEELAARDRPVDGDVPDLFT
jgi:predicted nucleotidyltransferase